MKKYIIILISTMIISMYTISTKAEPIDYTEDSRELQYQDILMLFLTPPIEKAVDRYYSRSLNVTPVVYPYQINVIDLKRKDSFRTFHFEVKLEVTPVVGPHISVGKDQIIFEIAPTLPSNVKLINYKHLETHELPQHWQHIKKNHDISFINKDNDKGFVSIVKNFAYYFQFEELVKPE
ncbi:DUF3888 domain-containing protein [Aquibacillus halophilus]|uniref:DUF3888 domain-containing protein n=1 Tax=Aquibacillus halophilus TaxID=930132 RepID=A0A6A8DDG2_9BACI|nr:DUF3888 domain-containing protein [Aquibacillus halophilus]MRH43745.1 DUF3888 domain-containing protein [Aquibacillus halophilus]